MLRKEKLKAVTMGHNLHELTMLVGTVSLTRSIVPERFSPDSKACAPKKYVLKIGVKTAWPTATFVARDKRRDE
jgi:hypothetical protein